MATLGPITVETTEGILTAADGKQLYIKSWQPPPDSTKARLVWLHGFSDHCSNYDEFSRTLASHGIAVHSLDQRGWGRSVTRHSEKGRSGPPQTVLSDITDFVDSLPQTDQPLFLGGHSIGGAKALQWASSAARTPLKTRLAFRGYVIAAPFIRFHHSVAPSRFLVWLVSLVARWFPHLQLYTPPRPQVANGDGENEALCHSWCTLQCIVNMIRTGDEIADGLHDLIETETEPASLWIGQGDCDVIVCSDAASAYFARSPIRDKQFRTYKDCQHNLHDGPGRNKDDFADDVVSWIVERVEAAGTAETKLDY